MKYYGNLKTRGIQVKLQGIFLKDCWKKYQNHCIKYMIVVCRSLSYIEKALKKYCLFVLHV